MTILGLNYSPHDFGPGVLAGHDSACALIWGDELVAAQEERFGARVKATGAFPEHALRACLGHSRLAVSDLEHVAFFLSPGHAVLRKLGYLARGLPASLAQLGRALAGARYDRAARSPLATPRRVLEACGAGRDQRSFRFHLVEHHLAHAASAYYPSPFDEAAVLCVDMLGDGATGLLAHGQGERLRALETLPYPHSLGGLYSAVTKHLGFRPQRDECVVMALSAQGEPERFQPLFEGLIGVSSARGALRLDTRWLNLHFSQFGAGPMFAGRLVAATCPARRPQEPLEQVHRDLAAALQEATERCLLALARRVLERTGSRRLCLAGGLALNCVANGRLARELDLDGLFVPPVPGDSGTSLGAALWVHVTRLGRPRPAPLRDACLGPELPDAGAQRALLCAGAEPLERGELAERVVQLLLAGRLVGICEGRMEFGPRALGQRSILADPRRPASRELLNRAVKRRHSFQPFAPAVLAERAGEWFEARHLSPFMAVAAPSRPAARAAVPAVLHSDGSARVQLVERDGPRLLREVLLRFERRTGVPMVLNTSFNGRDEPIVNTVSDALRCFEATGLDALVADGHLLCAAGSRAPLRDAPQPTDGVRCP